MASDAFTEASRRLFAEFGQQVPLAAVQAVVDQCRRDLDPPSPAALPELTERLARHRLTDHVASHPPSPQSEDHT
jgi:hypothetical protein